MFRTRVIPCLLLQGNALVKTVKFKNPTYVGDPVNAMRIFSEKEVDEIVVLDIDATRLGREPNYELIAEMAGEAFMPMAYGGGIKNLHQVRRLVRCGIEKVVINSAAAESTSVIYESARLFGSQAVVVAVDVRKTLWGGYRLAVCSGTRELKSRLTDHVKAMVAAGAGEIFVNNIDRDGTMSGYDLDLIREVSGCVDVPVIACGGAGGVEHLQAAISEGGASAVAAGSIFVFHGKHRAVLINYPKDRIV